MKIDDVPCTDVVSCLCITKAKESLQVMNKTRVQLTRCSGCAIFYTPRGEQFCPTCKMVANDERQFITEQIQKFEKFYDTAFVRTDDYIFPDDEEIEFDVDVDLSELHQIHDTSIDIDGILHYKSNTVDTDDYVDR
jgi:hypothetical protein